MELQNLPTSALVISPGDLYNLFQSVWKLFSGDLSFSKATDKNLFRFVRDKCDMFAIQDCKGRWGGNRQQLHLSSFQRQGDNIFTFNSCPPYKSWQLGIPCLDHGPMGKAPHCLLIKLEKRGRVRRQPDSIQNWLDSNTFSKTQKLKARLGGGWWRG